MAKTIKFTAKDPYGWEVQPKPFPASQAIPEWWRSVTPYEISPDNPDGKKLIVKNALSNTTFKKCTPMLDALTTGYILPLWSDVQVTIEQDGSPRIDWKVTRPVFDVHGSASYNVEPPVGYRNTVFKYLNTWIPQTPPGYSTLVTAPFGYRNLPFYAIPAVIDSDTSTLQLIPPVWIKEGFEGIVEKGTPLVQLTPFKRDDWKSEFSFLQEGEYERKEDKLFRSNIVNNYVKNSWHKKTYK